MVIMMFEIALAVIVISTIIYLARLAALPKPIPGIPYNKNAANRISGDGPEMREAAGKRSVRLWMRNQFARHKSPIVQLFIRPFGRPNVLVSDFRESMDILIRRTKEFDRSNRSIEAFSGLVAHSHIAMRTSDVRFRHSKGLIRDLMSLGFLRDVSAPQVDEKMQNLLDLWDLKIQERTGKEFEAGGDLDMVALDVIMAVAFGIPKSESTLARQVADYWHDHIEDRSNDDRKIIQFPKATMDPAWEALIWLSRSISVAFRARMPRLEHWIFLQKPQARKMMRLKKQLIADQIDLGVKRLYEQRSRASSDEGSLKQLKLKCGVDQMLLREMVAAEANGRRPDFHRSEISDEAFLYVFGGHDSISATLAWLVKYAARYQMVQSHVREALYTKHSTAREEGRMPTANEIFGSSIPYLDAFIEETLRCSHTAPAVLRQATVDTHILGHHIRKGTDIFLNTSAASFMQPAFTIDDEARSASARRANDQRRWDPAHVGDFVPERWLDRDGTFNSRAGPMLAFGAGLRSCFGRKLAYLELRIAVTLMLWRFKFLETSDAGSFEAVDSLSQHPAKCFVRLQPIV